MTGDAVESSHCRIIQLRNATLQEKILVVIIGRPDIVETQPIIALVRGAQTTGLSTEIGRSLEAHRSGGLTKSVVQTALFQTVHPQSATLTGKTLVVMMGMMVSAGTQPIFAIVTDVLTTSF